MTKKLISFLIAGLLLIIAIGWDFYSHKSFSEQSVANTIRQSLEHELASVEDEAQKISADTSFINWSSLRHPFYLIEKGKIISWSKNDFPIEVSDLEGDYKWKLFHSPRTNFLLHQKKIGASKYLIGLIFLSTQYEIVNRYLTPSWNEHIFPVQGIKILSVSYSSGAAVCTKAQGCLFKIGVASDSFVPNKFSTPIALLAILFASIGIY